MRGLAPETCRKNAAMQVLNVELSYVPRKRGYIDQACITAIPTTGLSISASDSVWTAIETYPQSMFCGLDIEKKYEKKLKDYQNLIIRISRHSSERPLFDKPSSITFRYHYR